MATLLELKTQARERADQVNSQFVSDSELNSFVNNSYAELYDLIVQTDEDYYLLSVNFILDGSTNTQLLPTDFYKLKGLDMSLSGAGNDNWITVPQFTFSERNRTNRLLNRLTYGLHNIQYRVTANNIMILPEDKAGGSYRLWYIPRYTPLVLDTDVMDGVNGFEEYIIVDAAIKMMAKEESDVGVLMAQKAELKKRIQAMAGNRDFAFPEKVGDVTSNDMRGLYPFYT